MVYKGEKIQLERKTSSQHTTIPGILDINTTIVVAQICNCISQMCAFPNSTLVMPNLSTNKEMQLSGATHFDYHHAL